jgi:hypothetical protein
VGSAFVQGARCDATTYPINQHGQLQALAAAPVSDVEILDSISTWLHRRAQALELKRYERPIVRTIEPDHVRARIT